MEMWEVINDDEEKVIWQRGNWGKARISNLILSRTLLIFFHGCFIYFIMDCLVIWLLHYPWKLGLFFLDLSPPSLGRISSGTHIFLYLPSPIFLVRKKNMEEYRDIMLFISLGHGKLSYSSSMELIYKMFFGCSVRSIVILNLDCYGGGRHPWGHPMPEYLEKVCVTFVHEIFLIVWLVSWFSIIKNSCKCCLSLPLIMFGIGILLELIDELGGIPSFLVCHCTIYADNSADSRCIALCIIMYLKSIFS